MAFIQKRGKGKNTYAVIYSYKDPQSNKNISKWECGFTKEEAEREETKSICNSETDASFFQAIKLSGSFLKSGSLFKL